MISGTIQQFYSEVLWGKLDVLLVDLPPGTADAAITVIKNLPLSGALLVTSPQQLAALVVRKAFHMLQSLDVPVLGLIENFSYFRDPQTGSIHQIFGPSHAGEIAELTGSPRLLRLAIDPALTGLCDAGRIEQADTTALEPLLDLFLPTSTVASNKI